MELSDHRDVCKGNKGGQGASTDWTMWCQSASDVEVTHDYFTVTERDVVVCTVLELLADTAG